MTSDDGAPGDEAAIDRRKHRGSYAARAWLVWTGLALVIAVLVEQAIGSQLEARARDDARRAAATHVDALRGSITREVSLLAAMRSFVDSRHSRAALDREFPTFVDGVRSGSGVRALQLVEGSRIVAVWPLAGNEQALGLDLSIRPDKGETDDLRRALASSRVTITGPIKLVQGGRGLVVRQRLQPRAGFPDMAVVLLDMDSLVASAGIPSRRSGLFIEVHDRSGAWFAGDSAGSAFAPESLSVPTEDGDFKVLVSPVGGWGVSNGPWRAAMRGILVVLVLSAGMIGALLGRRRERLEQEVRRSATALELVLSSGKMGGFEEDLRSRRVRWTPSIKQVVGKEASELGTRFEGLLALLETEDRERLALAWSQSRAGENAGFVEEVRVQGSAGERRWLLAIAEVKRDEAGRPVALVGIIADASEHRMLEERVRHAQRLGELGRLAGSIGTDFQRLLDSVNAAVGRTQARLTELSATLAEAVRAELDEMQGVVHRGAALTKQLLAFSQRADVTPTPLELSAAVHELLPTLERLVTPEARVEARLAEGAPPTLIDSGQFGQVLVNLVVNARDAMPEGGTITVSTFHVSKDVQARPLDAPAGDWVALRVADHGIGMSAATRDRIFEPYFTTKPSGRGTGLGLSVVYGIVEGSGGVTVVRSGEGKGTVFDVYFPVRRGIAA